MTTNTTIVRRATQVASAATALAVLGVGVAAACHPQGVITKDVQDVTTSSSRVAANTSSAALNVHPGDTLTYFITISDTATGDQDQMINTKITDQLPAGLALVKADSFTVGTVAQGKSVQRSVTVKVTAKTAGLIENEACFTGDSLDYKLPQKGCDLAYVNVVVPKPTPTPSATPSATPTPSVTPTPSATPTPTGEVLSTSTQAPTLPDTGADFGASTIGLGAMISAGVAYIKSRKNLK